MVLAFQIEMACCRKYFRLKSFFLLGNLEDQKKESCRGFLRDKNMEKKEKVEERIRKRKINYTSELCEIVLNASVSESHINISICLVEFFEGFLLNWLRAFAF